MGEHLRRLLEEGLLVASEGPKGVAQFAEEHRLAPALVQLLDELGRAFSSAGEAMSWLERSMPAFGASPLDLIAQGEAARVARALAAFNAGAPA